MKRGKYASIIAGMLLLGAALTGCREQPEYSPGTTPDDLYELEENEYGLGFTISLGSMSRSGSLVHGTGRSTEAEDYVDTEHLYILFFNIDGIYLFNINQATAVPMGQTGSESDRQWFIKIPVKEIHPNLIRYIEEHPFKIAVLANWTFNEDANLGGNLGSGEDRWDAFEFRMPLDESGNLTVDNNGNLIGDHISLLAHCERDDAYESTKLKGGYDHLVDRTINENPHMGPYTEWVHNYHKSEAQAKTDLRSGYDVLNRKYRNSELGIEYPNLWRIWNFGGRASSEDALYYESGTASIREAWIGLNESARAKFNLEERDGSGNAYWKSDAADDLYIHGAASWNAEGTGIRIGAFPAEFTESRNDAGDGFPSEDAISYIHFNARADGYVRVRYKSEGGAKLKVHIGLENFPAADATQRKHNVESRDESDDYNKVIRTKGKEGEPDTFEAYGDIPNIPKQVFLYCLQDGTSGSGAEGADGEEPEPSVTIYEIEYLESRHLYDIDRRGISPTKDYPIPMYGIQDFEAIGEYWEPGILFNLSMFNNAARGDYPYRKVSLLRSLARVEVILPKSAFPRKPSHVFLRSMNRSARITPIDFFTPTDLIWNGFDRTKESDLRRLQYYVNSYNFAEQEIISGCTGVDGEIASIRQYGPIYIGSGQNSGLSAEQKLDEYRMTTAWPFGIWEQQWGWNWNRDNEPGGQVRYFETYKPGQSRTYHGQTVPDYPKILHTRISRSDYARFTDISDSDGSNWHYILYVPEKNITDADNPGDISDRPKIIHVELRFNGGLDDEKWGENRVDNLDDNGAYRLYFTEGGRATAAGFTFEGRQSWDDYERNWEIASQHWPILRNHIYRFTVNGGLDYYNNNITFEVSAPDRRTGSWNFY